TTSRRRLFMFTGAVLSLMLRRPPRPTPFPYTTLFRSSREPEVYGHATLAQIDADLAARAQAAGHRLESLQSNAEYVLVERVQAADRKSTRLNSSHVKISYAVFCLKKKKKTEQQDPITQ